MRINSNEVIVISNYIILEIKELDNNSNEN